MTANSADTVEMLQDVASLFDNVSSFGMED